MTFTPDLTPDMLIRAGMVASATRSYKARKTQADKAQVQFDHGEITAEMLEKSQNDLLWATGGLATSIVNITEAVEYAKRTHQQEQAVEYPDMV